MGVGVLTSDRKGWITRRVLDVSLHMLDVFLSIPNLADAGPLVLLNGDSTQASTGLMEGASVLYPHMKAEAGVK